MNMFIYFKMRRILTLLVAMALIFGFGVMAAKAYNPDTVYFPIYQEQDESKNWYYSSNREHVFYCGGYLMARPNYNVRCPGAVMRLYIEIFATDKFWERVHAINRLNYEARIKAKEARRKAKKRSS